MDFGRYTMWENTNYRPQKKEKEKSFPGKYFLEIEERKTKHFLFDFPNEKKKAFVYHFTCPPHR